MTELETNPEKPNSFLIDIGPVIAYVVSFRLGRKFINPDEPFHFLGMNFSGSDAPLYIGSVVFAIAVVLAGLYSKMKFGRISLILWITGLIVLSSVAITILFRDPTVFKMKPTVINVLYGSVILGSLAVGKNVFRLLFADTFTLPDKVWRTLAIRWGLFFFFLAGVNEYVWRNYSVDFWTDFKLIGMLPISFVFALLNVPLLMKYMPQNED